MARKILRDKDINHDEIDMRKDGVPEEVIRFWVEKYGLKLILNVKSATWRELDDRLKAEIINDPARVININPAMLHRPILDFGQEIILGKDALSWLSEQSA